MCPKYREFKNMIIKYKFPIPFIDELLDKLQGTIFFTKLGLHFGYHQIKMRKEDIMKISFSTYEGNYEFLVMSFGLTSAPTFQRLMNSIFKPLEYFVSIFYNMLIYI